MRTKMKRLLLAVLMLGMPMLQSEMYAGSIKVTKSNGPREHFPHLMPPHNSNSAFATWDEEVGILSKDIDVSLQVLFEIV